MQVVYHFVYIKISSDILYVYEIYIDTEKFAWPQNEISINFRMLFYN